MWRRLRIHVLGQITRQCEASLIRLSRQCISRRQLHAITTQGLQLFSHTLPAGSDVPEVAHHRADLVVGRQGLLCRVSYGVSLSPSSMPTRSVVNIMHTVTSTMSPYAAIGWPRKLFFSLSVIRLLQTTDRRYSLLDNA